MHTFGTRTYTHPFSPCLPISILHDPCKWWTKPHAYHSGHPREGSPKGRHLHILWKCGNNGKGSRCQETFLCQSPSQSSCEGREALHHFQQSRYHATLCWLRAEAHLQQPLTWLMQSRCTFKSFQPLAFHLGGARSIQCATGALSNFISDCETLAIGQW